MGIFLIDSQPHAAVSFEIGGNFKPDENSVLIVAVPHTKSNFILYFIIILESPSNPQ
jgi:hypothetical protein